MSSTHVSDRLRQRVANRAEHICEYCLIEEEDAYVGLQVDHIISKKHGGKTTSQNLALACACCNR
jgi:5-methylcytosine-specific restriction endonuclease McrA